MGRLKFRLSNMIPIAWFYKLKHMNKSKNQNLNKHPYSSSSLSRSSSLIPTNSSSSSSTLSSSSSSLLFVPQHTHRTSQYFKRDLPTPRTFEFQNSGHIPDTQFIDSPRKCSRRRGSSRVSSPRPNSTSKKNPVTQTDDFKSLIMKNSIFGKSLDLELPPIETINKSRLKTEKETKTHDGTSSKTMNWSVRELSVPITPTHDHKSLTLKDSIFGKSLDLQLPPIATKKKPRLKTETRHGTSSEQGTKKKKKGRRSRSRVLESLAVVKLSMNPQTDFMESIVEMIVENDIKGSKDLEDLLACYLQLNSDEHHELIINVFKQIGLGLPKQG